ncbi:MAG: EamA family transporter [Kiloniellales bacterium]
MTPALYGLMTAFGWGGADFIARFTGRAMGHEVALFAMLTVGALLFGLIVWLGGLPLAWDWSGAWLLVSSGVAIMVATLLLYWGLARGPVTLVAPLVGAYPALNVLLELSLGARPSALQWIAMGVVMAGVIVVARAANAFEDEAEFSRAALRKTTIIALASAVGFAVAVAAAQHAAQIYGELQTVVMGRWVSLAAILLWLLFRRRRPVVPLRWWPLVVLQGLLDAGAYVALLSAGTGEGGAVAVVVASCFAAVTVVLARVVLKEAMTYAQWGGIAAIIAGVATLSAQG